MYMTQIESNGFVQFVCTAAPKALCFICGSRKGHVINFTQESVINCRNLLEARQDRKLKFSDVLIPLEVDHYDGYHQKCFDAFSNLDEPSPSTEAPTPGPSTSKSSSEQANEKAVGIKAAVKRKLQNETNKEKSVATSKKDDPSPDKDETGIENCFFCGQKDVDGKEEKLCKMKEKMFRNLSYHAEVIGNVEMYEKFEEASFEDFEKVRFHSICKRKFQHNSNAVKSMTQKKPVSHTKDDKMELIYSELCLYVQERIMKKHGCISLSSLGLYYKNRFDTKFKKSAQYPADLFIKNNIEDKLLDTFKDQLTVVTKEDQRILKLANNFQIIHHKLESLRKLEILEKAAHILREDISNIKSDNLTIDTIKTDMLKTKFVYPRILKDFHETLLTGMSRRKNQSFRCMRLSDSFSQDMIYAVSMGHLKTQKHMSLPVTIKCHSSSTARAKQMINILNRYGHCCSYTTLKQMERKFGWSNDQSDDDGYNRSDPGSDSDI